MTATATASATRKRKTSGIVLSAADLKSAFNTVGGAVHDRTPRPVLRNVLIADGSITGTDLEVQVRTIIDIDAPPFLLPFARAASILRLCRDDEQITLTPDASSCVIATENGRWTLPTEDAAEFPVMSADGAKSIGHLPADQFGWAVKAVSYACTKDGGRFAMSAVCIDVDGDAINFVATDGRRLSLVKVDHDLAVDKTTTLVPQRTMDLLQRIAEDAGGEESVQLDATKGELIATIGSTVVTARQVDGAFPRWRDVFPKREIEATVVDRNSLESATRAAAIATSEQSKGVTLAFSKTGIWLHGKSSEAGESSVTCDVVEAGNESTVKLDPRFVVDFLKHLPADGEPNVEVEAGAPDAAVMLRNGDVFGIVMPLGE